MVEMLHLTKVEIGASREDVLVQFSSERNNECGYKICGLQISEDGVCSADITANITAD